MNFARLPLFALLLAAAAPAFAQLSDSLTAGAADSTAGGTANGTTGTSAGETKNDGGKSAQPFTIDAEESLEYRQAERLYVARGRAKVTRNGASITADTLTAYERDKAGTKAGTKESAASRSTAPAPPAASPVTGGGNTEIWKFEAEGNVVIDNGNAEQPSTAYGDRAVYDIDSQRAVLTGSNLHLDSGAPAAKSRITARDSFEYLTDKHEAIANGNAKAVQSPTADNLATRTVSADQLHVFFTDDGQSGKTAGKTGGKTADKTMGGSLTADHTEARGHVRVTTETPANPQTGAQKQTSTATSDSAIFDNKGNQATLIGNVKIARGPNQLEGARGEIDMNSGVSRLLAAPAADGKPRARVRGLLIPGSGVVTAPGDAPDNAAGDMPANKASAETEQP